MDEWELARLPSVVRRELELYLSRLSASSVPVILNAHHLADLIGLKTDALMAAAFHPLSFYRRFSIPKKRGGHRTIEAPLPSLLFIQRWIVENVLSNITVHDAAHGFVLGKSIITNAQKHVGCRCLLKLDIAEFFPSIAFPRVMAIFLDIGYSHQVSLVLASLCCLRGRLPQGSAASPMLSNIISRRLDGRLSEFAKQYALSYTRYADDMTFSGRDISIWHQKCLTEIIREEGFRINDEKSVLIRGAGKKIVTGISISRGVMKLPKQTKRAIRSRSHFLIRNGILHESFAREVRDPLFVDRVLGLLNFWKTVEPENPYPHLATQRILNQLASLKVR